MFTALLFMIAKTWQQPRYHPSVGEWIYKLWYLRTMEYYSVLKRKELSSHEKTWKNLKIILLDFPGGAVVKNPPANAGDTSSSLGLGGSHMPRINWARAPQLLSLRSGAHKPQVLSPHATTAEARVPRACALQWEKPPQ